MDRVSLVETFHDRCALWRYRCPVELIGDALQQEGSRYSPEFDVGGVQWRLHLQHRTAPQSSEVYLAVHLQCCSPKGAYGHFRITICNRDPSLHKSKTFHCHFKKAGSAWGLHQFIALDTLLSAERGYLDDGTWGEAAVSGRRSAAPSQSLRYVVMDIIIHVLEPSSDGSYSLGALPQATHSVAHSVAAPNASRPRYELSSSRGPSASRAQMPLTLAGAAGGTAVGSGGVYAVDALAATHVKATLVYPFEHLEGLCDMWFEVGTVRIPAHRCVVAVRMAPLLPGDILPLTTGCTVSIQAPMDVFSAFLKYVYTEDYPEAGVLRAEALLDLYLLAAQCEFFDLCGVCLRFVRPLLTVENILPLVLTRYNAADEVLTALYLRVLLDHYDALISDKQFEEIPGHLFRRLSLILRDKEKLPAIQIPLSKHTLGKQLAALAESGEYSDLEIPVNGSLTLKAHRFILASRSVAFSQAFHPKANPSVQVVPSLAAAEFQFSARAWTKALATIYRRHTDSPKELSAEDIAVLFKTTAAWVMDGHVKREAEAAIGVANALRVLVYAVQHSIGELRERAMQLIGGNFASLARQDPSIWDFIGELPQPGVVTLFRTVAEAAADGR